MASVAEERGRIAAALADLTVQAWPSDANFILFRPLGRDGRDVWVDLLDRRRPDPGLLGLGRPAGLPAGDGGHPGRERPVPRRVEGEPG